MKNDEEILLEKCKNPDLLILAGSKLYGTATETSDEDLRGVVLPPFEYLIGIKNFECKEFEGDHKVFSLKRFLYLSSIGDPQSIEVLCAPEKNILKCSEIGEKIFGLKSHLISKIISNRIIGYSVSEWRKAFGEKLIIEKRTNSEDQIINDIRNKFHPEKGEMDNILEILFKNKERKVVPSISGMGKRRKEEFEKFGYCPKSASHSIRLLDQLLELLKTGDLVFPRKNSDFLLDIKKGKCTIEEVKEAYEESHKKVKEEKEKSILQEKPNMKKVWNVYKEIVMENFKNDLLGVKVL